MALRFAIKVGLVGLLTVAGAVWHAAPTAGVQAAGGASARTVFETASPSSADPVIKSNADTDSAVAAFLRIPWSGEDEESSKVVASSFEKTPRRGTEPFYVEIGVWLASASSFLSPFKTGPPSSES